jgi:uncharacterized membrane protein
MDVLSQAVRPAVIALAAGACAFAVFAFTLLQRSDALLLPAYDTAFFQQVVWNIAHGGGFRGTFFPASFLGLHFEPLLAVPAALELAWSDERMLSLLHALGLAATAPAAYLLLDGLARHRFGGWLAAALAALLPFGAALEQAARAGFHPEALALPLTLLAGWAGLRGRWALCWSLALVAIAAKEDQAYSVAVVGALLFMHGPSRRQGAALATLSMLWGVAVVWVVMPALRGGLVSQVDSYYHWLRDAGVGQVATTVPNPAGWLALAGMILSLGGLPLLRPEWLLLALPPFAADLLSAHQPQPELHLQYALPLLVPLLVAAGLGARRLPDRLPSPAVAGVAVPVLAIGAGTGLPVAATAVPGAGETSSRARLLACTADLPARAAVAADDDTAAVLASRPSLRLLTEAQPGDWVVVDRQDRQPDYVWQPDRSRVLLGLGGGGRRLACDDGRFQLWTPVAGDHG